MMVKLPDGPTVPRSNSLPGHVHKICLSHGILLKPHDTIPDHTIRWDIYMLYIQTCIVYIICKYYIYIYVSYQFISKIFYTCTQCAMCIYVNAIKWIQVMPTLSENEELRMPQDIDNCLVVKKLFLKI